MFARPHIPERVIIFENFGDTGQTCNRITAKRFHLIRA